MKVTIQTMPVLIAVSVAAAIVLGGCATKQTASVYTSSAVQQKMAVKLGTVVDVRDVVIQTASNGLGATAGGAIGAVAGSRLGRGPDAVVGAVVGAVAVGVAGAVVEEATRQTAGIEVLYQVDGSSETMALVQAQERSGRFGLTCLGILQSA